MCANTSQSSVTSQELCKEMWLGESQSTNTDLRNKWTNAVKINMNIIKDWKAFEQIELDLDLNHTVKISSQNVQGQQTWLMKLRVDWHFCLVSWDLWYGSYLEKWTTDWNEALSCVLTLRGFSEVKRLLLSSGHCQVLAWTTDLLHQAASTNQFSPVFKTVNSMQNLARCKPAGSQNSVKELITSADSVFSWDKDNKLIFQWCWLTFSTKYPYLSAQSCT